MELLLANADKITVTKQWEINDGGKGEKRLRKINLM